MNYERVKYTLAHKLAYLKIEKHLTGRISLTGLLHDMDKLIAFMFTNQSRAQIKAKHRAKQAHHHFDNPNLPREVRIEMMIDWECSPLTKPDKPENAYQFLCKYMPHMKPQMMPIFEEFGLLNKEAL